MAGPYTVTFSGHDLLGAVSRRCRQITVDCAPNVQLELQTTGTGGGTFGVLPDGEACSSGAGTCFRFPHGTTVDLLAIPASESVFIGWSGDCSGVEDLVTLTLTSDTTCTARFDIGGEVLTPSDSLGYQYDVYTVPAQFSSAVVEADVTWSSDWYPPPPHERTQSGPNLVEVPFIGGFGCDHVWKHSQNNFENFDIQPADPSARRVADITVPGDTTVSIAGSDCFFDDNFRGHHSVKWRVVELVP